MKQAHKNGRRQQPFGMMCYTTFIVPPQNFCDKLDLSKTCAPETFQRVVMLEKKTDMVAKGKLMRRLFTLLIVIVI
jgi:hypothetical protein